MVRHGSPRPTRRGVVAPLAAILMVVMLGMIAFAVDVGYIVLSRTEAQNAADAAALAGMNKLAEHLKTAKLVDGVPVQTQADLDAARAEAKTFALNNRVGGKGPVVKDAEVEFGYLADPFNQNTNTNLDTSGWPARPYNAVRVAVHRDNNHTGGPLDLFFAPVLGVKQATASATATAVVSMGTFTPQGNNASGPGGLLPFTYQVDQWHALLKATAAGNITIPAIPGVLPATTFTVFDSYKVDTSKTGTESVSSGTDQMLEVRLFPTNNTPGNYGTINFTKTKSSNSTSVLRDLIEKGPATDDWADLSDILKAKPDSPVSVNGDPGISAGMESAVKAIVGQPRVLPLFTTFSGNGNNTFYKIVEFVPVTVVAVNLNGGSKYIMIQPRVISTKDALGSGRLNIPITPSSTPNPLFLGSRALVR